MKLNKFGILFLISFGWIIFVIELIQIINKYGSFKVWIYSALIFYSIVILISSFLFGGYYAVVFSMVSKN